MVMLNQTSFQFKYNTLDQQATQMSESKPSLTAKGEVKSSLKKRVQPALQAKLNGSKSKALESIEDKGLSEMTNVAALEDQIDQKLLSNKSSKKEKLRHKNQVMFLKQMAEAERSERSAKIMGSFDKNTTIKENHNTIVESNQREFSHSRDPEENLSVSKKKITTESKKSKAVESGTKHSKTETKNEEVASVSATEIKEQKVLNTVDEIANDAGNEKVEEKPERVEEKPREENPQPEAVEPKKSTRKASKSKESKAGHTKEIEVGKDTKMSKNLKRSEVSKSEKEVDEEKEKEKGLKRSKSVKHGLRSETKSKDSKLNAVKSGVKKSKPNERWH